MGLAKSESKIKIGILGGTFDPAHKGHIAISKLALKKFKLQKVYWAITKKNPFKTKSSLSLKKRIIYAKKINVNNKFIEIGFYENKIKSNKTFNLIKFFLKKNKKTKIYFIMGADNLVNFHKWEKYNSITNLCKILVFDRDGFRSKSLKSLSFKKFNKKSLEFIKFNKVKISSSQLRKI
tara:strand:- start:710 stop:1246 length:537 start_codon:yes stop_codon:yes gene_type:complete